MTSPYIRLDYHLVPTAILYQMHPRGFPHQHSTSSSFLQKQFQNAVLTTVGQLCKKVHLSQYFHSRQATLHATCIAIQVLSYHNKIIKINTISLHRHWVRFSYAITVAQYLHLQHPPQTGRKKQIPKVSQICPLTTFYFRLPSKVTD